MELLEVNVLIENAPSLNRKRGEKGGVRVRLSKVMAIQHPFPFKYYVQCKMDEPNVCLRPVPSFGIGKY